MGGYRILISGFFYGRPSGFGRFTSELCRALGDVDADAEFLVAVPESVAPEALRPRKNLSYIRLRDANFAVWEQISIPLCARRESCDVIHYLYNTRSVFSAGAKVVTTVHDLTFFNTATQRSLKDRIHNLYVTTAFRSATWRSDAIIAVSRTTQSALLKRGLASSCIYNTVDGFLAASPAATLPDPPRPYFLHRGGYSLGHRNTARVIQAFLSSPALTSRFDLKILGVPDGAAVWGTTEHEPVHYLEAMTDAELAQLYAQASCVVAASLLEGFCLPIIEAFGFGVPVIASNVDPMMEIAGDAALLVSPHDTSALREAMVRVVSEPALADDLTEKGRGRMAAFASDRVARELLAVYDQVSG